MRQSDRIHARYEARAKSWIHTQSATDCRVFFLITFLEMLVSRPDSVRFLWFLAQTTPFFALSTLRYSEEPTSCKKREIWGCAKSAPPLIVKLGIYIKYHYWSCLVYLDQDQFAVRFAMDSAKRLWTPLGWFLGNIFTSFSRWRSPEPSHSLFIFVICNRRATPKKRYLVLIHAGGRYLLKTSTLVAILQTTQY